MGIRIQRTGRNTWSAPLQLIDCWLPLPAVAVHRPRMSDIAQRFARAGWLSRGHGAQAHAAHSAPAKPRTDGPAQSSRGAAAPSRSDARVLLSGRIDDVCAELDRLAALESRWQPAAH